MANRLVEVQRLRPDDNIKTIVTSLHLEDIATLESLNHDQSLAKIKNIAICLVQVLQAKKDPLANQLMKEFQITFTPSAPAAEPGIEKKP